MSRLLMRAALILLGAAWLAHAIGTVWRPEAGPEVSEVLAARSVHDLGAPVAETLRAAGIEGVDDDAISDALAATTKVTDGVRDAASEVWEAELEGRAARLGDALGWTVEVARDDTTTVTVDPAVIGDALAELDPAYAEAWNTHEQLRQPVTVDVSSVANIASIGALPAVIATWAWPLAALGLIAAALAVVVAVGRRAAVAATFAWVLIAAGAATYIAMRALSWAAQRDDTAGLTAELATTAGAPLNTQAALVIVAGVAALAGAAALKVLSPTR